MTQREERLMVAGPAGSGGAAGITDPWEVAYVRFETPEEEISKFVARLKRLGIDRLPRDARVVELFCGRGNGLHALERLGFTNLEGADLSERLIALYRGPAKCHVCDCRKLPFADGSKDALIVQGGLHHLPTLPESLAETFAEMHRVLRKDGRAIIVEPWLTPFLRFVHSVSSVRLVRRCSPKLDALATMIDYERPTYEQWLGQPELILELVRAHFTPIQETFAWGKWMFVGQPL
ncbi:MAG TPA: class I SAM-dependent methyltransferase [Verrucomicrobiae bacterium]|nr:class I SAM-dependent methyltransferase [Verrucomicrobiae bacterium]